MIGLENKSTSCSFVLNIGGSRSFEKDLIGHDTPKNNKTCIWTHYTSSNRVDFVSWECSVDIEPKE